MPLDSLWPNIPGICHITNKTLLLLVVGLCVSSHVI
jgi:hypothetical protein